MSTTTKMFGTSTLASLINTMNATGYEIFGILLGSLFGFVLAVSIIVAVWWLVRHFIRSFR